MRDCGCGSGECREARYDGYGIFLTYVCGACEADKMSRFREDIDERYDTDDVIDEDPDPMADAALDRAEVEAEAFGEYLLAARDEGFPPGTWDVDPDGDY